MTTSQCEDDPVKRLRVGIAVRLAKRRAPRPHIGLHPREVWELALVARDRPKLEFHRLRDVHGYLVLLFRPFDDVNLANLMWLVVGEQLREGHVVAGKGVDTVKDRPARDAVVPVGGEEVARPVGILGDDQIGPPLSDLTGDVSPEVAWTCPGLVDTWVKLPMRRDSSVARTPGG